jgi:chemotaxis protein MotB
VLEILVGGGNAKGKDKSETKSPPPPPKTDPRLPAAAAPQTVELLPTLEYLNAELKREVEAGKMHISLEARGLVVSLRQATFFPSGEDTIDPATYPSLEKVATAICKLPNPVRLEGHTDAIPIHTARFRSNWDLSAARAIAVLELLTVRFHVPVERLAIAGYAETIPVAANDTEDGRARNRRVDVVILNRQQLVNEPVPAPGAAAKPGLRPAQPSAPKP